MFVGRKEELKELKDKYNTDTTEIISVLGRRRVGKSQLIFHSYKDFDGLVISYECSDTGYKDNLEGIEKLIKKILKNEYIHFNSLYDVMMFLQNVASKQKILFIIDEYLYMRESKATDSMIKNAIDEFDKMDKKNPFKFVLCGSSVQVMEILDNANMPLHGRFTKTIHLYPLNYLESSLFYKDASLVDKVKYYSTIGGTPYFLNQIDPKLSFDENIVNLYFGDNALLKNELDSQINGEINKIEKATYILNIIQDKMVSYSDINQIYNSRYKEGSIDYPLKKLIEMKVIEKINVQQDNGKNKPYYRIIDNAIKFYYSYLIRSLANRNLFSNKDYYEKFIKEDLNQHFIPLMFEGVGYQFIALMNQHNKLDDTLYDLFTYIINDKKTKNNYQFDVVGKSKKGLINFECKFKDMEVNKEEVEKENRQAELANSNFYKTVFISKNIVDTNEKVYSLVDVYNYGLLD